MLTNPDRHAGPSAQSLSDTRVSSAEDVALIAAYRYDVLAVDFDLQTAHRFAEAAGVVVSGLLGAVVPHYSSGEGTALWRVAGQTSLAYCQLKAKSSAFSFEIAVFGASNQWLSWQANPVHPRTA